MNRRDLLRSLIAAPVAAAVAKELPPTTKTPDLVIEWEYQLETPLVGGAYTTGGALNVSKPVIYRKEWPR